MRQILLLLLLSGFSFTINAQYRFDGFIDSNRWQSDVYLSIIEDYRTLQGINDEQIITRVTPDNNGYFLFKGNQLDSEPKIYKLHVDNCETYNQGSNHFDGHCSDSKDILFIASKNDSITFPMSFETQMFCDVISNNPKTAAFIKIDSLKEEMKYAYSEFRSKANRDLNNKKWFKTLQNYGESMNEPLAELYIYSFLSDRSNQFHKYYLEDLKHNNYYDELLVRLKNTYPNSTYTRQYEAELTSDKYIVFPNSKKASSFEWTWIIFTLLVLSLLLNLWLLFSAKKRKQKLHLEAKEQLTNQEQNVLELLLNNYTNKDIADTLFVSVSTVKTHVNNVFKKLNVNSRDELKSLFNK